MTEPTSDTIIDTYLQSDAGPRRDLFRSFVRALKAASGGEPETVRALAVRAVSPDLDYTSLQRLGRVIRGLDAKVHGGKAGPRIAILGGPTTTQLTELVEVFLADLNPRPVIYEAEYGLFRQEILTPGSELDRFQPDIVFIATGARDVTCALPPHAPPDAVAADVTREVEGYASLWDLVQSRWHAMVIQNLFDVPPWDVMGHHAVRLPAARQRVIQQLNVRFAESAPEHVVLHDLPAVVVESGSQEWFDPRYYHEAKMPCGPECLVPYAHSVASLTKAMLGRSRKVLVLDLDNTMWGGVIGDVGLEEIQVGQGSGEGEAFLHLQAYARDLKDRGIILAVCSKNDDPVAREPFERRPDMILKLSDFACFVANWNNKADNLRQIAERLDLGLDSFVFIDDNPAERAVVRRFAPEVAVPDLPEDPAGYVEAVARHRFFETVAWTTEDADRASYYAQNAQRAEQREQATDLNAFLQSIDMRASVRPVTDVNIKRVTQLVNKSNQFNLTTVRRTLAEINQIAGSPEWWTVTVSLADSLGDNGLISVLFLERQDRVMNIDTWLMSCRVLQRGVEQYVLNWLVAKAQEAGCAEIRGTYVPTDRNGMVEDHYDKLGFSRCGEENGTTEWTLAVDDAFEPLLTFIREEPEE